jgi:hypothetical protein
MEVAYELTMNAREVGIIAGAILLVSILLIVL